MNIWNKYYLFKEKRIRKNRLNSLPEQERIWEFTLDEFVEFCHNNDSYINTLLITITLRVDASKNKDPLALRFVEGVIRRIKLKANRVCRITKPITGYLPIEQARINKNIFGDIKTIKSMFP